MQNLPLAHPLITINITHFDHYKYMKITNFDGNMLANQTYALHHMWHIVHFFHIIKNQAVQFAFCFVTTLAGEKA